MMRCGKPPRITHTPSAATSIVTAVGPRPTFCWPATTRDHTERDVACPAPASLDGRPARPARAPRADPGLAPARGHAARGGRQADARGHRRGPHAPGAVRAARLPPPREQAAPPPLGDPAAARIDAPGGARHGLGA